jgi:phosphoribosylanthranilate isomerase
MFRVKICGITKPQDALAVAESGADAIGLNFYPPSARFVELDTAKAIIEMLPKEVKRIGLFVNATLDQVRETYAALDLDAVQLHGDESPEMLAELPDIPIIRALRLSEEGIDPVHRYLRALADHGVTPKALILDSYQKDLYGGTGKTANWPEAARYYQPEQETPLPPLILAGGLTPENVAEAVRAVGPYGVDTAGGVESAPGVKSAEKVCEFVRNAREALGVEG